MEDKKVKAGSVAVGICLFVIAILLVLIVVFFYNTTIEKNNLQGKVSELETKIEENDENVKTENNNNSNSYLKNFYTSVSKELDVGNMIQVNVFSEVYGIDFLVVNSEGEAYIYPASNSKLYKETKFNEKLGNVCKIGDNVANIFWIQTGNGLGDDYVMMLNRDGTVSYIEFDIDENSEIKFDLNAKKIENVNNISNIIQIEGNGEVGIGGYGFLLIKSDGTCLPYFTIDNYNEEKVLTGEEAKKLIKEKYELAIDLFCGVEEFQYISDINDSRVIKEKVEGQNYDWYYYPITNYDEIINKYLSNNIKSYFEEKNGMIITRNNKKYTTDGGVGFISYDAIEEIKDINITDEKIKCIVKIKCSDIDGKFTEYRESDFSIIKEGDNWLIEKFDFDKIF